MKNKNCLYCNGLVILLALVIFYLPQIHTQNEQVNELDFSAYIVNSDPKTVIETKLSIKLPSNLEIVEFTPEDKRGSFGAKVKIDNNDVIVILEQLDSFFNGREILEELRIPLGFGNVHDWWDLDNDTIDTAYHGFVGIDEFAPFCYSIYVFITMEVDGYRYVYISY